MTAARQSAILAAVPESAAPQYELRVRRAAPAESRYEVWQLPAAATPQIAAPVRVAGLRGRNLELVEHRVLVWLSRAGIRPATEPAARLAGNPAAGRRAGARGYRLTEELALTIGLLFRALAPMRSRDAMRAVVEGIEAMGREEAAYWLGMAMHRQRPRRVLTALRVLLTEPRRRRRRPGGVRR